ncbi:MAG: bifunctional phosphoribosylaminoimidazolecarboxamide formyltransferase/IMP cyclohydrolase [Verrucomicrobiota bacterium]|nr:bifunctional phosphoribosylaminoimidazolecarboxamide formyltransferase/IMP cyclohydrolase [Verrucomicrobiota bacterium]
MQKYALLSVSDKSGLVPFARSLVETYSFTLLSTGGTAQLLRDEKIPVMDVSEKTGFPEMMDGRVKTLHPKIHGGLLCLRDHPEHLSAAREHEIDLIDLVVVNLYPFEQTIAREGVTMEEAIEQIDIGGPSMLRSAAKNHRDVSVVCDPADYDRVLRAMESGEEELAKLRRELALKVFARTAEYDSAIAGYLNEQQGLEPDLDAISGFPKILEVSSEKALPLRYGENPHQQAALYGGFLDHFEQLQGKELSYNNILDISSSAYLIGEFERPTVAILKHTNPCGVASADNLVDAWERAFETDRQAPFGGIIVVNNTLDIDLAEKIGEIFCEVIIAPGFTDQAMELFQRKKNLRLLVSKAGFGAETLQEVKTIPGGYLAQDRDQKKSNPKAFEIVTERQPSEQEWRSMIFGWKVVKHVKSNAIVYAGDERTLGVGAGQMSRVDSSRIAVWKAGEANLSLNGAAVCSDAFFPFSDGLLAAADAGATAAIQPGGSVRDEDVIAAANERGMTMAFTHTRHFKH